MIELGRFAALVRLLPNSAEKKPLPEAYHRIFWRWFAFGFPAFAAVITIFWLMITRPQFSFV